MGTSANSTGRQIAESFLLDPGERRKLLEFARGRFGIASQDAEDLIQDTALELLRNPSFVQSPEGFVLAVFRSRCARFLSAHRQREQPADPMFLEEAVACANGQIEARIALREALGEISSTCRRILCAYYIEGKSLNEAARAMALASSGVFKTISRCLKRLRACLN